MGDTGSGKSSCLNSLLDEEDILPTNGMRACTASIIEMRYDDMHANTTTTTTSTTTMDNDKQYAAEIEFLSVEEWRQECQALFDDLHDEYGNVIKRPSADSQAGIALAKMRVVYGAHTVAKPELLGNVDKLLEKQTTITKALGTIKHIRETNAKLFRKKIELYADSTNSTTEMAFWPIVKRICLKSNKWNVLKSGAVLVDAPGVTIIQVYWWPC